MHVSRVTHLPTRAARAYALDLEFVKCRNTVLARSVAFVPFRRGASQQPSHTPATSTSPPVTLPALTTLCDTPTVLELQPRVTLALAEALPCGHLLSNMVAARFAPTPALTAVLQRYQNEASSTLDAYRDLRHKITSAAKEQKRQGKRDAAAILERETETQENAFDEEEELLEGESDVSDAASEKSTSLTNVDQKSADNNGTRDNDNGSSRGAERSFRVSAPTESLDVMSQAQAIVMAALQRRNAIVRNFCGFDPYGIPNVRVFSRGALEQLHAAPIGSADFDKAARQLARLRSFGRGKGGFKSLVHLARHHPEFLQQVLRAAFETPTAWGAWLTECCEKVEEDLWRVRNAHVAEAQGQTSSTYSSGVSAASGTREATALRYVECGTLEELAGQLDRLWAELLRGGHVGNAETATRHTASSRSSLPPPPPKMFVYGNGDQSVLHATLALCKGPPIPSLTLSLSERSVKAGRFLRHPTSSPTAAPPKRREGTSESSTDLHAEKAPGEGRGESSVARLVSPYEARVLDITQHPLFTAAGFAPSPKSVPNLTAALEKAATRDATAAAVLAQQRQHDALWDAQALACVCAVSGAVR